MKACSNTELLLKSISFVEKAERTNKSAVPCCRPSTRPAVIQPWVEGWENHMDCYHGVDVALDPLPYGGATTTCEALSMVPVISLGGSNGKPAQQQHPGEHPAPRMGARSSSEYVSLAMKLSTSRTARSLKERQALRNQLLKSPLGNGQRVSRELERHYLKLIMQQFHYETLSGDE